MRTATGDRRARALGYALALALAAPAGVRAAEVNLSAKVDRAAIAEDEHVVLEVRVEAPEPPSRTHVPDDTADFHVVGTATTTESAISLGGGAGVQIKQAFVGRIELAPRRAGALSTPQVEVTVRGRLYLTPVVKVQVRPAGTPPPPGARAAPPAQGAEPDQEEDQRRPLYRGWEKDLVLKVEVDRKEVFQGEQVVASVVLYSPLGVVNLERFEPPVLDGFWTEPLEVPKSAQYHLRRVNGVPTRVYLIQRLALFPNRAGALTIPAAELQAVVRLGNGGPLDLFADTVSATRRSQPVTLTVKPLPAGAPAGFQPSSVGTFELAATAAPEQARAGEPVSIRLTATGDGNLRALSLPALPPIPGTRAYPATATDATAGQGERFRGSRTLETVIIPERPGALEVPALEWPYFDPRTGAYAVARTAPLHLVVGAAPPSTPSSAAPAAPGANPLAAGLRAIRAEGALARSGPPPWQGLPFALLLALPPLLLAAVAGWQRAAAAGAATTRAAGRSAQHRLDAARRRLGRGDRRAFVTEVERALTGYASQRLGRSAAGLTREALLAALGRAGAHPPAVRALAAALDAVELARYGGGGGGPELLDAAERALALLEEADWSAAAEATP
jgi:hypothetical protein